MMKDHIEQAIDGKKFVSQLFFEVWQGEMAEKGIDIKVVEADLQRIYSRGWDDAVSKCLKSLPKDSPIYLMQDGVSFDFHQAEAYRAALRDTKTALSSLAGKKDYTL